MNTNRITKKIILGGFILAGNIGAKAQTITLTSATPSTSTTVGGGSSVSIGSGAGSSLTTAGASNVFIGIQAGRVNTSGTGNSFLGANSGFNNTTGLQNVFTGSNAGYFNTTGTRNVFTGYNAGYSNTTGSYNVFTGSNAGLSNTTGGSNVFTGVGSGQSNTSGFENVFTGVNAGFGNTTGFYNAFTGVNAGLRNTTGYWNVFNGFNAGHSNMTGYGNSFFGFQAGGANTTGAGNTSMGQFALYSNETGNNNTALGNSSNVSATNLSNATALGAGSIVTASNKMQLGNTITATISTAGGYTIASDARFKNNIKEEVPGLDFIKSLRPVSYNFDYTYFDAHAHQNDTNYKPASDYQESMGKLNKKREIGFLAQEVEALVTKTQLPFNGVYAPQNETDNYALDYSKFTIPLVKAVQEQQAIIETLQKQIDEIKKLLSQKLESTPSSEPELGQLIELKQNTPNPFSKKTTIVYKYPETLGKAEIVLADLSGKQINSISLNNNAGQVEISANDLTDGTYIYSLVAGGKILKSNEMVVVKP